MKQKLFNDLVIRKNVREAKSVEDFTALMRADKPTEIFCGPWSHKTPLYVLSRHTKGGCRVVCNARQDRTPQWVPYIGLYKIMKNGLSESYYVAADMRSQEAEAEGGGDGKV